MPHFFATAPLRYLLALSTVLLLAGCELSDIPGLGPDPKALQKEAEAKAIGGACRHALRGLEDCYTLNPKASKAQIFAGWKEMDLYMRENKIEGTPSMLTQLQPPADPAPAPSTKKKRAADPDDESEAAPRASGKRS